MGVDCSARLAFGVSFSQEDIEDILEELGIEYDHDEPYYELADRYGLNCTEVGTYYSKSGLRYVIGPSVCFNADFQGTNPNATVQADPKGCRSLKKMLSEIDSTGKLEPQWVHTTLWS